MVAGARFALRDDARNLSVHLTTVTMAGIPQGPEVEHLNERHSLPLLEEPFETGAGALLRDH
ncbi:MAG TPA: hypothetical protein PKE40_12705, partial [Arachnia sp.]|nr:hypothetical protein [Arachnia sp.]HMT87203.1 hypothetical protein [Arachnia sp.]